MEAEPEGESEQRVRVLFVEDEHDVRTKMCELLTAAGLEIVEATDGEDALEKLREGAAFDALVTDVRMPRMNGLELLEKINLWWPELSSRTIVISGVVDDSLSFPPHFVLLRKPCDTSHLLDALHACGVKQISRRSESWRQ